MEKRIIIARAWKPCFLLFAMLCSIRLQQRANTTAIPASIHTNTAILAPAHALKPVGERQRRRTGRKPRDETCVEVVAIDRHDLRKDATRSANHPSSQCDTLVLQRASPGTSWRRATWAKVDVLFQHARLVRRYDYVFVRDIDTKVNSTHVLRALAAGRETFVVGYIRQEGGSDMCDNVTAVTNWFGFRRGDRTIRRWFRSRRNQTDQFIFNNKFRPCCSEDVLCFDKCEPFVNEVHCRRPLEVQQHRHYGSQRECIERRTEPNPAFYAPNGLYECRNGMGGYVV